MRSGKKRKRSQMSRSERKRLRASRQAKTGRGPVKFQLDSQNAPGGGLPGQPAPAIPQSSQLKLVTDLVARLGKDGQIRLGHVPKDRVREQAGPQLLDAERRLRENREASGETERAFCCIDWSPILSALDGFYCAKCSAYFSHDVREWVGMQLQDQFLFKFCEQHAGDEPDMAELLKTAVHWFSRCPPVSVLDFVLRSPQEEDRMHGGIASEPQVLPRDVQRLRIEEELEKGNSDPAHRVLAQHGRYFVSQARPPEVPRMPAGACVASALHVSERRPGATCALGLALNGSGEVATHVWCLDADGRVVDPTWVGNENLEYYGVPVRANLLRNFLKQENTWLKLESLKEAELLDSIVTLPGHGENSHREES